MDKLKKKVTQAFKLSGYVIRSENSTFLAEQLLPFEPSEHDKWLTTVIENIQNLKLDSTNIDRSVIEKAIVEINRVGLQEHETVFSVIDAFDVPRFVYNTLSKKFELNNEPRAMISDAINQVRYLVERYNMLYQKTARHELFSPSIIQKSDEEETKKFKLLHVENLLASTEMKEVVVLGQLNQIEEGKLFIEDPTGYVQVDLKDTRYHSGFFCEGSFVLAEGSYENKILKIDGLGFPPAEPATSSRAFFGTANSWGGPSEKLLKYSTALQEVERTNTEATMVFLSDVELDIPEVIAKLRKLFVGYDSCPPVCIVLMGPFSTTSHFVDDLIPLFKKLADATSGCDQLKKETDLIIVPHSDDPVALDILPRWDIPEGLCEDLIKAWPRTKLMSNPCRLQYCSQQIVVFCMDLMSRLARNAIHFPDTKTIDNHFARTLICQGHLMPMSRYRYPIFWDYDTSLWLYPLPDLVVIGDSCQSFSITQHGCTILNTGSFPKSKYCFKMYIPSTKTIEDSEIPEGFDDDVIPVQPSPEASDEDNDYDENRIIPTTGLEGGLESNRMESEASQDTEQSAIPDDGHETETPDDAEESEIPDDEEGSEIPDDSDKPGPSGLSRDELMQGYTRVPLFGTVGRKDGNKKIPEPTEIIKKALVKDLSDVPLAAGLDLGDPDKIAENIELERLKIMEALENASDSDSSD